MNKLLSAIVSWIPLAVAVTLLSGILQVSVQQTYRANADDPQISFAQNTAEQLADGFAPTELITPDFSSLDIATSMDTALAIYSAGKTLVVANATMNGAPFPTPPSGVFDAAREKTENRVTWQPKDDIRLATVVRYVSGETPYYVLSARSLQEVEAREANLWRIVLLGWICTLFFTLLAQIGVNVVRGTQE